MGFLYPFKSVILKSILLTAVLFLCGGTGQAPGRELVLKLLVWDGYAPEDTRSSFTRMVEEKYHITLKFEVSLASGPHEFFDRLRTGTVDMISPAHNLPKDFRFNLTTSGLTLPVNLDNIPNYSKLRPDLQRQPWAMEGDQIYGIPIVYGIYGLAYNITKIKTMPDTWGVLWNPKYRGLYTVNRDYYELNIYISALAMGYDANDIFIYDKIKGPDLEQRLKSLAVHSGPFWQGFDRVEHYKHAWLATTWRFGFPRDEPGFKDWRIAIPREGTTAWADVMMLSRTLDGRPLAKKIAENWINYLLEPEIQAVALAKRMGTCPVTSEAYDLYLEKILDPEDKVQLTRHSQHLIPWKLLAARDRNAYRLLWKEALMERAQKKGTESE